MPGEPNTPAPSGANSTTTTTSSMADLTTALQNTTNPTTMAELITSAIQNGTLTTQNVTDVLTTAFNMTTEAVTTVMSTVMSTMAPGTTPDNGGDDKTAGGAWTPLDYVLRVGLPIVAGTAMIATYAYHKYKQNHQISPADANIEASLQGNLPLTDADIEASLQGDLPLAELNRVCDAAARIQGSPADSPASPVASSAAKAKVKDSSCVIS